MGYDPYLDSLKVAVLASCSALCGAVIGEFSMPVPCQFCTATCSHRNSSKGYPYSQLSSNAQSH